MRQRILKGTVAQGHFRGTYFLALNLCHTMQINDVTSQTIGAALLPNGGRFMPFLVSMSLLLRSPCSQAL